MNGIVQRLGAMWFLLAFLALGWFAAFAGPGADELKQSAYYPFFLNTLLAIGLYACVRGIELEHVLDARRRILAVVTVGVALKIALIGAAVYAYTGDYNSFVFAIIVAQIDPLSISALTLRGNSRISPQAQSFLLAWSSFDDPVTVVAAILAAQYVLGVDLNLLADGWLLQLGNIAIPCIAYGAHVYFRTLSGAWRERLEFPLLVAVFAASIVFGWMLAVALTGLFLRPSFRGWGKYVIPTAYALSLVLLGTYLTHGVDLTLGVALALAAVGAQAITAFAFNWKESRLDTLYLASAQQNGITAVILSLFFVKSMPEITAVVVVAILVINVIHIAAFAGVDKYANMTQPAKGAAPADEGQQAAKGQPPASPVSCPATGE